MNKQKYLDLVVNRGLTFGDISHHFLTDNYRELELSSELNNRILEAIEMKSNFEILISEFSELKEALYKKIEELLKHPDFDPFKEELRKHSPEQYSSYPYTYKGVTYYLYFKAIPSDIDSSIMQINSFIEIIDYHKKVNSSLKFVYEP